MGQTENIWININKISSFIFMLKIKIDNSIANGCIVDSNDCVDLIELELVKSDNVYQSNTNEGLINLRDQIFLYYYADENISEVPLIEKIKVLSLLN